MKWSDVSDLSWRDLKKAVRGMDREDVLHRLGLEEHTPKADFFTGLGVFAVGVLIGAGLGVMFAPKPGAEIRSRLTDTIKQRAGRAEEMPQASGMPGASSVTSSRIS